jgi:DNA-binding MarR family transcriptional regulator
MGAHLGHFLQLQHLVRAALREALTDLDLTPVQNTVLHLVDATPGSSSAELARVTQVTPQTMHRLVTELEHRGLLALRSRPGHGRIRDATLTDLGRRLLAEAAEREQAVEDRLISGLDQARRDALLELLRHCVATFGGHPDDRRRADGTAPPDRCPTPG